MARSNFILLCRAKSQHSGLPESKYAFYTQTCYGRLISMAADFRFAQLSVIPMSSSNGLICYRKEQFQELPEIFIYNPVTNECLMLTAPRLYDLCGSSFALAFFPFGTSSNMSSNFKVAAIHSGKYDPKGYYFLIYSSETGKWKLSMEVCHCKDDIFKHKHIFVGGKFYWMTMGQHVITFDIELEVSGVIELPGPVLEDGGLRTACLGETDGCLSYVCSDVSSLWVWSLKDSFKSEWVLKHSLNLDQLHINVPTTGRSLRRHLRLLYLAYFISMRQKHLGLALRNLVFCDDVLFLLAWGMYYQYNLRTGTLHELIGWLSINDCVEVFVTAHLYSPSLAAVGCLSQIKNKLEVASSSAARARRKRLIKMKRKTHPPYGKNR